MLFTVYFNSQLWMCCKVSNANNIERVQNAGVQEVGNLGNFGAEKIDPG